MTDQERSQVLKMIEDGKITPEQGLHLMQALEQREPDEAPSLSSGVSATEGSDREPKAKKPALDVDPRIERLKSTVRSLWQIPLWIGILVTVLSALGMFAVIRGPGMNIWFYFLLLPLFLGVALTALAAGSRRARWIFVDIHQHPGGHPKSILLGFPLPLRFTAWILRTFGHMIPSLQGTNVDEVIQVIESGFAGDEPLIVNVDEGIESERVQVYIG